MERTRRDVLRFGAFTAGISLAGCTTGSDLFGSPSGPYDVEGQEVIVMNESTDTRTVTVTITNSADKPIFDHTYTVKPDHGNQSLSLHGDPTDGSVRVTVSRGETIQEPYLPLSDPRNPYHGDVPPENCPAMDIVVEVYDDRMNVTYGC